jgi:hypothetical protein
LCYFHDCLARQSPRAVKILATGRQKHIGICVNMTNLAFDIYLFYLMMFCAVLKKVYPNKLDRRKNIVKCCGAKKCQKAYNKIGGIHGIEYQRNRRYRNWL